MHILGILFTFKREAFPLISSFFSVFFYIKINYFQFLILSSLAKVVSLNIVIIEIFCVFFLFLYKKREEITKGINNEDL